MALRKIEIGVELGNGWRLFQANMGLLVISGVLVVLIGLVTCGLLSMAMAAGQLLIISRLIKSDPVKPQAGDVFKGFEFIAQSLILLVVMFLIGTVLNMLPVIGQVASLVLGAFTSWALMFLVFQKLSAIDALKKVFDYTKTGEFTLPLVYAAIAGIIGSLGAVVCGIGLFFTLPLSLCMLVCAYQSLFGDQPETPAAVPPAPAPAPPAPAPAPAAPPAAPAPAETPPAAQAPVEAAENAPVAPPAEPEVDVAAPAQD